MKNFPVKNEVILAAAGSGKTFRLSDRIIKLLVNGAKPEEIVALTFTRAAAAEFITKTFSKLALAAKNEDEASELSKRLKLSEPWNTKQYRNLLRETLISMNRLSFGTLDSFFSKLVSNNAAEVGLDGGELKNLSEVEQNSIRGKIISQMLAELQLSQLCGDIRHINEGKVSATPLKVLDEQIKELHDLLTLTPKAELWGQAETIWGKLPLKLTIPLESEVESAIKIIYAWIEANPTAHTTFLKSLKDNSKIIAENKTWTSNFSKALKWFRNNLNGALDASENISFETTFGNSPKIILLDPHTCKSIRILNRKGYGLGIQIKLDLTQSIYKLLTIYEEKYNHTVRQQGNLTFSDNVTLLLKSETKANIDYRLDCSIKHWLFDEFQDTSTRQWKVLRNNLDEVANNSSDEPRTCFFVGDLKQSLYGWRGGNPEILRAVNNNSTFNDKSEKSSEEDSIEYTTRRCSAPIVELVNAFLDKDRLVEFGQYFSIIATQKWAESFRQHVSIAKDKEYGEAIWVRLKDELTLPNNTENGDDSGADTEDTGTIIKQAQWIGEHLRHTGLVEDRLLKQGITCAVLVSSNDVAAKTTETLRKMGIEAADEANAIIAMDNPFTAGLVALITNTVHPSDRFNEGLARMSPTAEKYINSCGNLENARLRCATQFIQGGAEALVQDFLRFADLEGADNSHAFLRKRAQQVITLAVNFDQNGIRNLGAFSSHLQESSLRDTADPRAVQVLTIHRSKGLEYTAVYLPGMNSRIHKHIIAAERETNPLISNNTETFSPNWILSRPNKVCSERDSDILNQALETERANVAYENLCKIYVGMTRATKRLVIISDELTVSSRTNLLTEKKTGKYDYACLLEAVLGQNSKSPIKYDLAGVKNAEIVWSSGSDEWIDRINPPIIEPAITLKRDPSKLIPVSRVQKNRPSKIAKVSKNKKQPKSNEAHGKEFGTLVHSLFQSLEWDTKTFSADINKKIIGLPENSYLTQAVRIIEQCLKSADIVKLLEDNSQNKILWKEKQAVIMNEGKMIDAVFDRVHIIPGKEAVIIDYKTNFDFSDDELEIEYKEQMNLYRISVSELTGIPVDKIKCVLINVRGASSKYVKF
jgi:ATP-dependent exoDNAse (exonuclease V) beta subunit